MIVDEFIENPKPLSAFSNPENHWPDFLALLGEKIPYASS